MVVVVESMDRLVSGYQCKSPAGRGPRGWRLGLERELWAAALGQERGRGSAQEGGRGEGEISLEAILS